VPAAKGKGGKKLGVVPPASTAGAMAVDADKGKRETKVWRPVGTCAPVVHEEGELLEALRNRTGGDNTFIKKKRYMQRNGTEVQTYCCSSSKHGCKYKARTLLDTHTETATIEVCGQHDHGNLDPAEHAGLTVPQRAYAEPILKAGKAPPSVIHAQIKDQPLLKPHPTLQQVVTFCQNNAQRLRLDGNTLAGFVDYAKKNPLDANDVDKVGVLNHQLDIKKEFRFLFSSPRLLKLLLPSSQKLVGVGPGGYCSPRHTLPSNSRDEGSTCLK